MRTVRSFAMEGHERARYDGCVRDAYRLGARRALATGVFLGLVSSVAQYALVVVLWVGCLQVIDGKLHFGHLTSFLLLAIYVVSSLGGLMGLFAELMQAVGASRRVFALLDAAPSMPLHGGDTIPAGRLRGSLALVGVSFAYPARPDVDVLRGMSLRVEAGQSVALVGASGGGKSSVVALVERFYDPQRGSITVDGVPLTSLDPSWWRQQVALVAQEPVLFSGSVLTNILYGVSNLASHSEPRAPVSRDDAVAAAKTANADGFISGFPDGYETAVGERGVQLSGGQKQRIAVARALLVDPTLLLLDEATSALDAASEAVVQQALDRLQERRTTLLIAHRLSTIRHADLICVVAGGVVVEQGTHGAMVGAGGPYEKLVRRQLE